MTVVALLWAVCFPLITIGLPDAPPLLFAALRALLAGGVLVALAAAKGPLAWPRRRELAELALIGLSFTALGFGGMFLGAGKLSAGVATVLANVQPLIAAILAFWFLHEALTGRMLVGLLTGFAGVVILAAPGVDFATGRLAGALHVLAGAAGTAVGTVLLKRRAGGGSVWLPMGLQLMIGAFILAVGSLVIGEQWSIRWSWTFAASLFVLSIPATALMVVLWYALLARAPLTLLNPFTFLAPAFGLLIGALALGERFSAFEMVGVAVTLVGLMPIAQGRGDRRREVMR
jgi:drug/metabolite transporter (DMT)-like permease